MTPFSKRKPFFQLGDRVWHASQNKWAVVSHEGWDDENEIKKDRTFRYYIDHSGTKERWSVPEWAISLTKSKRSMLRRVK